MSIILSALHLAVIAAVLLAALPWFILGALVLLLIGSWLYQLRRFAWLQLPDSIVWLVWQEGASTIKLRDEQEITVSILPDSTVWQSLLVLRLESGGRVRPLVIMNDMADADTLRRLRLLCRHAESQSG